MAGPGIRYWEMARALARQQPVTLLAPQPIDLAAAPPLACGRFVWGDRTSLAGALAAADVVIANGLLLHAFPELASIEQPLVLDLYDPIMLENFELFRAAPAAQRAAQHEQDRSLLLRQLAAGSLLLCATERQRDLYIGALMAIGRITPELADADPQLRGLIDVVGFGLPEEPPARQQPVLRGVLPGIGRDDLLLLWTGGLWDWLDPLTLIYAVAQAAAQVPHLRLVFLAGQHPGAAQPMRVPAAARALANDLGLLDRHVFFYDQWVPYQQRADFLLEADIAVSLHRHHLETSYAAVRSRFLDHLWAGLPSIVSDGDAAADLVRTCNLGYTVAPEDRNGVSAAIGRLASDPELRRQCAANARQTARSFTWQRTLAPLARFCSAPARDERHGGFSRLWLVGATPGIVQTHQGGSAGMQEDQQQIVHQIEETWQFGSAPPQGSALSKFFQNTLRRLLAPLLAQQRDFNAASVKLFYRILEDQDQVTTSFQAVMSQSVALQKDVYARLDVMQQDIHGRLDTIAEFNGELSKRLDTLHRDMHGRLDAIAKFGGELSERIDTLERDLHGRLDTIATFNSEVHDRLERLTHTMQMLDNAVAALDEASTALAGRITTLDEANTALAGRLTTLDEANTALAGQLTALQTEQRTPPPPAPPVAPESAPEEAAEDEAPAQPETDTEPDVGTRPGTGGTPRTSRSSRRGRKP